MLKVISWIIALLGLWEFGDIAALFVPNFGEIKAFVWNHIFVGFVLMLVGVWAARTGSLITAKAMNWISVVAGTWLILAPFVLGRPDMAVGLWNDIIVGAIVIILSVWALFTRSRMTV